MTQPERQFDVVVLTALPVERDAAVRALGAHPSYLWQGSRLHIGEVRGKRVLVFPLGGSGNVGAAEATQRVIGIWKPTMLVLVGIAGGVRNGPSDVCLGDVLVPNQIVGYEPGKMGTGGFEPDWKAYRPDPGLLATARDLDPAAWATRIQTQRPSDSVSRAWPVAHIDPVLSGEKVIADDSTLSTMRSAWPRAIGVEMEGVGVAQAAWSSGQRFFMAKGVSDFADSAKDDRWQAYAAEAAARFVVAVLAQAVILPELESRPAGEVARGPSDEETLRKAADELAVAVDSQWRDEAVSRNLRRFVPLQFTWGGIDGPSTAPLETIADPRGDHDHVRKVAEKFLALPHRRLVVLGESGAGKTVLGILLTLALLAGRAPGGAVPVLLGLPSWDPDAESLEIWLARRLGEDYPALTGHRYGPDAPSRLINSNLILPILDGLDELPQPLHSAAIAKLDWPWFWFNRPLVLTCRAQEYERAVAVSAALSGAAVIKLHPVAPDAAIGFLRAAAPPAARWDRVDAHLRACNAGTLAGALSTPLMVTLTQTTYSSPEQDPSELLRLAQDGDRAAVERHLLNRFVPAAYTTRPTTGTRKRRMRRSRPAQALHWLTLLAVHLDQQHTQDLAWWQLSRLIPQRTRRLVVGPCAGLAVGLPVGLAAWLTAGVAAGVAVLLATAFLGDAFGAALAAGSPAPTRVSRRPQRRLLDVLAEFEHDRMSITADISRKVGRAVGYAATLMIFIPIASGVITYWSREEAITDGFGLAFWFLLALLVGNILGHGIQLAFGLMEWLRTPADEARAVTPESSYHDDRRAAIVSGLLAGLLLGLTGVLLPVVDALLNLLLDWHIDLPELLSSVAFGFRIGLVVGLVGGVVGGLSVTAWGQFAIVRTWLTVRGELPPRLLAFLEDAHRQEGVLRQAGAVYQFRHARLQDHLAQAGADTNTTPTGATTAPPASNDAGHAGVRHGDGVEFAESMRRKIGTAAAASVLSLLGVALTVAFFGFLTERKFAPTFWVGFFALVTWLSVSERIAAIRFRLRLAIDRIGITIRYYQADARPGRQVLHLPWNQLSTVEIVKHARHQRLVCTPKPDSALSAANLSKKYWWPSTGGYVVDVGTLRGPTDEVHAALTRYSGCLYRSDPS